MFAYPQIVRTRAQKAVTKNDPDDPDSGWGSRTHKTIFPLFGKNVGIVPATAKGYMMDSTCNATYYIESDLSESYTIINRFISYKNQKFHSSVYCFLSDDYDGDDVRLLIYGSGIKSVDTSNNSNSYNLVNKGSWQRLNLTFECNDGEVNISLSFIKKNVRDFSSMKGYVIFASPCLSETGDNKLSLNLNDSHNCTNKSHSDSSKTQQESILYTESFETKSTNKVNLSGIINTKNSMTFMASRLIDYKSSCERNLFLGLSPQIQFKNWFGRIITEDTTYTPFKSNLIADHILTTFGEDRIARWKFACEIYLKEYNVTKKIFGGGFDFLNWYGFSFYDDKTRSDYPHNPFLYILLYSGIVGLILYLIILYKSIYFYIKYLYDYPLTFMFFLITFFFTFFSGGHPFDPPIMGFFLILPYFFHFIHKNEIIEPPVLPLG